MKVQPSLIFPSRSQSGGEKQTAKEPGAVASMPLSQGLHLGGRLLQVSNNIRTVLRLLEASEVHLGLRDVLLGVLKVDEQSVLLPSDSLQGYSVFSALSKGTFLALSAFRTPLHKQTHIQTRRAHFTTKTATLPCSCWQHCKRSQVPGQSGFPSSHED